MENISGGMNPTVQPKPKPVAHQLRKDGEGGGKVQTKFDVIATRTIVEVSTHYGVSQAEIIRTAVRLYTWASKQVRLGRDVGALDLSSGKFVAIDVPYPIPLVEKTD